MNDGKYVDEIKSMAQDNGVLEKIRKWFGTETFKDRYGQETYKIFIPTQAYGRLLHLLDEFKIRDRRGYDLAGYGCNVSEKLIVEWCEGDVYLQKFESEQTFAKALERQNAWVKEQLGC